MASEDLSARVASLVQKNLAGRLLFRPLTPLACDWGLGGHVVVQLNQNPSVFMRIFLHVHAYG